MDSKQATLNSFSIAETQKRIHIHGQAAFKLYESCRSLLLLLFLCHAPVFLIWLKIIPFGYRFFAFAFVLAGLVGFGRYRQYSFAKLDFRTDNLKSSLAWNLGLGSKIGHFTLSRYS